MLYTFHLSIVTENQKRKEKAEGLAHKIASLLGLEHSVSIKPYHKFENSFRIEMKGKLPEGDPVRQATALADQICTPWLSWYHREEGLLELIFNKDEHCRFREQQFNVIRWAQVQLV